MILLNALRAPLIVLGSVFATKLAHDAYYLDKEKLKELFYKDLFNLIRSIPIIGTKVNQKIDKELKPMLDEIAQDIASIHENVRGLEVPVNDALVVRILHGIADL